MVLKELELIYSNRIHHLWDTNSPRKSNESDVNEKAAEFKARQKE